MRLWKCALLCVYCLGTWTAQAAPSRYDQIIQAGQNALQQGKPAEAERQFRRALKETPKLKNNSKGAEAAVLAMLGQALLSQGRQDEAFALTPQVIDAFEAALGPENTAFASILNDIALLLKRYNRFADAELLLRRAVSIYEQAQGEESLDLASSLNALGSLLHQTGDASGSESLLKRTLAIRERLLGSEHPDTAESLSNLAILHSSRGDYPAAESLLKRSVAILEKNRGRNHPDTAQVKHNLASLYRETLQFDQAEDLFKQAIQIRETAFGPHHPTVAQSISGRALNHLNRGQPIQAEPLLKKSLVILEKAYGPDSPASVEPLANLGQLYMLQSRNAEAENYLFHSLELLKKYFGPEHPTYASVLNNLAMLYNTAGLPAKAEPLFRQGIAIQEKRLGADHPSLAVSLSNLATTYLSTQQYELAEPLYQRALSIIERAWGENHPYTATLLNNLGYLYASQANYAQAYQYYARAFSIAETNLPASHPNLAVNSNNLAEVFEKQGQYAQAIPYSRRSVSILRNRITRAQDDRTVLGNQEQRQHGGYFVYHARLLANHLTQQPAETPNLISEVFDTFQLARSSDAGQAMAQTMHRLAADSPVLAAKVRERQDALGGWRQLDKQLTDLLGRPAAQRNTEMEKELRQRITTHESTIKRIDDQLLRDFPAYRELTNPSPLPLAEAQKMLGPDEAMVSWLVLDQETLVFVVRRDRVSLHKIGATLERVTALVRRLRNATEFPVSGDLLPFPYEAAHELYKQLFGAIESDLTDIKHLILVPDGPLQSLSFGLLKVGADGTEDKPNEIPWLARRYSLTTLPSITSLRALRIMTKSTRQREAFIGFGDPVLSGDPAETRGISAAKLFSQGLVADTRAIAKLQPLPDTANELKMIASTLRASEKNIYLRNAASETRVKQIPLDRYRTVAFATHGLMAGEFKGLQEPALVLTPPANGTEHDDGLLTASEIAALKLDADWVILSACNTAAPDGTPGAQGFTGLSKAFFYAGARSLLVSHWAVESKAAMRLTTQMIEAFQKGAGKAEALRRSMMMLADQPDTQHPAFWAPFVVVGEGH